MVPVPLAVTPLPVKFIVVAVPRLLPAFCTVTPPPPPVFEMDCIVLLEFL